MDAGPDQTLPDRCAALIEDLGLGARGDITRVVPLTGGVASDIARVDLGERRYCAKFALARLRVAAEWTAPVRRNRAEYAWLRFAGATSPGSAPRTFGRSNRLGGFVMECIDGDDVILWKSALLAENADAGQAAAVADALGRIHAASAQPGFDASAFRNAEDFAALRIEPYLICAARVHPAAADRLAALAQGLVREQGVLVHGDVSPKNVLFRDGAPVLLDAECATLGDPAFDVAFCLNHLVLKAFHAPASAARRRADLEAFRTTYVRHVAWEDPTALELRIAALLPALMLARVDGKSPVEYLSPDAQASVRAASLALLADGPRALGATMAAIAARIGG